MCEQQAKTINSLL